MSDFKFILYLDMDGVTASSSYIIKIHNYIINKEDENKDWEYRNFMQNWCFQKEAVECLNSIYDIIPYKIVLSTTRRFELDINGWNTVFKINKIKAEIIGRTSKCAFDKNKYTWREDEIYKYHYIDHDLKDVSLIIIDDDSFDLQKFEDKLIKVDGTEGLTMKYYKEILDKLYKQGIMYKGDSNEY